MYLDNNGMSAWHIHLCDGFDPGDLAHHVITALVGSPLATPTPEIYSEQDQTDDKKHCTDANKADQKGKASSLDSLRLIGGVLPSVVIHSLIITGVALFCPPSKNSKNPVFSGSLEFTGTK